MALIVNSGLGNYINGRLKYLYFSRVNFRIFKPRKIKLSRLSVSVREVRNINSFLITTSGEEATVEI